MTITVAENPVTLTSDFTTDKTAGQAPCDVQFTDASTGGATTWSWAFGDGTTSVEKNPKHTFAKDGSFDVVLTVSDGKDHSATKNMPITITKAPAPVVAAFTEDRTTGDSPLTVQFTDQSQNAVSYEWVFGEGNTSTDKSPGHIYTSAGNYTVVLTANGSNGDKSTAQATITVTSKPQP
jgi:PKD repeat protein